MGCSETCGQREAKGRSQDRGTLSDFLLKIPVNIKALALVPYDAKGGAGQRLGCPEGVMYQLQAELTTVPPERPGRAGSTQRQGEASQGRIKGKQSAGGGAKSSEPIPCAQRKWGRKAAFHEECV